MPPFGATRADPEGIALREVSRAKKGQSPAVFLTRGTRNGKPQVKPRRRMNSQTRRTERRDQRGEGGGGGAGDEVLGASVRSGGADAGRGRTVQGAGSCSSPAPEVYKRRRPTLPNGFNF